MAKPAVEVTQRALFNFGPTLLTQDFFDKSVKPHGAMLPRLQAPPGAGRNQATDPHVAGRALDIVLFANDPLEQDYANRIVQVFAGLRQKMNFISVIYNSWEWNGAGVKFPHVKGNRHETHIHIEWGSAGATKTDFASDLEEALFQEFYPDAAKEKNLMGRWQVTFDTGWSWFYTFSRANQAFCTDIKDPPEITARGTWFLEDKSVKIRWRTSSEEWFLPIDPTGQRGRSLVGQGGLSAKKVS